LSMGLMISSVQMAKKASKKPYLLLIGGREGQAG